MLRKIPFHIRLTCIYIILGALWILYSDNFLHSLTDDPVTIHQISLYKGWFYVLITGLLIYILIRREIKRRIKIEEQLKDAIIKAEESDKLKTAFLSNLSHYIRTPMNAILGFTSLLEDKDIDESKQHLFRTYIHERSHHLLKTLNSIIDISKLQEGLIDVENEEFSLNNLIDSFADLLMLETEKQNKKIQVIASKPLQNGEDLLCSDEAKISQILSCLAINAVNYSNEGRIEIGYYLQNEKIILFVADSGCGIPQEKIDSLFKNYLFNSSYTKPVGEGAGLSLYLCNELAMLIGGKLWLQQTGVTGTTICLTLIKQ